MPKPKGAKGNGNAPGAAVLAATAGAGGNLPKPGWLNRANVASELQGCGRYRRKGNLDINRVFHNTKS